jgi:peptide/nickel transport system substrate-binding protein
MKRFVLLLLAVSSLLAAHAAIASTRPQYGGTLRVMMHISPNSLDPLDDSQGDSVARNNLTELLFDTLVITDAQGHIHPALAASWQGDSGNQRWIFSLRHDVKFHDGSLLTADAVAASLRNANPNWRILADANSVIIERDSPFPALLADLARPRNAIAKRDGPSISGTGPFRVKSFAAGRHLTLAANEESWRGRPFLDTIEIDFGKSGRDQLIAIQSGRADLVEVTADQTVHAALNAPQQLLSSAPVELIALVYLREPKTGDDRNLRSALALSIDRTSIRRAILQSSGQATAALLPNWISGYAFVFPAVQNLPLARQKISGMRQPPALTLAYDSSDPFVQLVAERITLNARDAGLTLQSTSSATPDLRLLRISLDSADPWIALDQIASRLALPEPQLSASSAASLYQAENAALQAQRVVPLFYVSATYGLGSQVRDASLTLIGTPRLADVWIGAPAP